MKINLNLNYTIIKNFHKLTFQKVSPTTLPLNQLKRFFARNTTSSTVSIKEKAIGFDSGWKEKYVSNSTSQIKNIKKELGEERVNYIIEVAKAYASLNKYQVEALNKRIDEYNSQLTSLSSLDFNHEWPKSIEAENENIQDKDKDKDISTTFTADTLNKQYSEYIDLMSLFSNWIKSQQGLNLGFGSNSSASSSAEISNQSNESKQKKAEIVEEVKEKQIYDLYLQSFDASKKITVIKTVREITGLGLKEAKELVETCPQKIKDKVKKDDVKGIIDKVEAAGGKVEAK